MCLPYFPNGEKLTLIEYQSRISKLRTGRSSLFSSATLEVTPWPPTAPAHGEDFVQEKAADLCGLAAKGVWNHGGRVFDSRRKRVSVAPQSKVETPSGAVIPNPWRQDFRPNFITPHHIPRYEILEKNFFCELSLFKAVEANWIVIKVGVKFMQIMKIILAHRSMHNKKNTKNCHKISKCIQRE